MTKKEVRIQLEIDVALFLLTKKITKLRPQKTPKTKNVNVATKHWNTSWIDVKL